jgi:hypothetical protein
LRRKGTHDSAEPSDAPLFGGTTKGTGGSSSSTGRASSGAGHFGTRAWARADGGGAGEVQPGQLILQRHLRDAYGKHQLRENEFERVYKVRGAVGGVSGRWAGLWFHPSMALVMNKPAKLSIQQLMGMPFVHFLRWVW